MHRQAHACPKAAQAPDTMTTKKDRPSLATEMTPEGLKPWVEAPHGQSIRRLTRRRLDLAIVAVLIGAPVSIITVGRRCP